MWFQIERAIGARYFTANASPLQLKCRAGDVLGGDLEADVFGAEVVELLGHDVLGELGLVAFAAEVREVELAEVGGDDLGDGFGGGDVGDVTVTAEDALLESPGTARTVLEHLHVVVGFEDEDVRGADALEHQLRDMAEVGGKADGAGGGAQDKTHRVLSVVRDGKSFDANIADLETCAGFEQPPVDLGFEVFCSVHAFEGGFLL